ncbi:PQQ-binding-like beta-propeller repeat protein [Streptomyces sp.]|uniref:outer membrane protein assembly factor BamB family protein n=1 Tax=Streptomyces sp. TaxID=1931 RepID=UPI002F93E177
MFLQSCSAVMATVALAAVTGCTQGPDRPAAAQQTPAEALPGPTRVAHDPPEKFDLQGGVRMPWEASSGLISVGGTWLARKKIPVALHRETAYVATPDRVLAFDTTKGVVKNVIRPESEPLTELAPDNRNGAAPPVVTEGSTPLMLASFLVRQPGEGTKAARDLIEVVAADAGTGKLTWRLPLTMPEGAMEGMDPSVVSVVGASGHVAVVTVSSDDNVIYSASTTYGIDLRTHRLLWTRDEFQASAVTEGIVTGEVRNEPSDDYSSAAGYDLATGTERWRGPERLNLDLHPAGPHLVQARARDKSDSNIRYEQFLDPKTGAVKKNVSKTATGANCDHDGARTVVCGIGGSESPVTAFDAVSGATLWQLPDANAGRIAPRVTAVWHGRVYGETDDGALSLDARTGADVPTRPGIAPDLVNEYTGVALSPSTDELTAYPTIS